MKKDGFMAKYGFLIIFGLCIFLACLNAFCQADAAQTSPKRITFQGVLLGFNRTTPIQDFTKLKRRDFDISLMALWAWHPVKNQTLIVGVRYMQGFDKSNYRYPLFQISVAKRIF